jgi:hypothetical protein
VRSREKTVLAPLFYLAVLSEFPTRAIVRMLHCLIRPVGAEEEEEAEEAEEEILEGI